MAAPLISICLPNLNQCRFLAERMETILAQTVRDWELIICDSFSDDGSWEFFQKFKGDPRVRLHQVPREGLYAGWNECLQRATGRFVHMATSDDTAQPKFLESLLSPLEKLPEIRLAYCDFRYIDEHGTGIEPSREKPKRKFLGEWANIPAIRDGKTEFLLSACFGVMWFTMSSVLFRRDLLDDVGQFRRDRGSQADLEWGLRALLRTDAVYVPGQLATWRVHENQASSSQAYDWEFFHTLLDCFACVLHDPASPVPEVWKAVTDWDEQVTWVWRQAYLDRFGLYRGILRRAPRRFLRGYAAAWRYEPAWAFAQTLRGFNWMEPLDDRKVDHARRLIETFQGKWPPQKIALN